MTRLGQLRSSGILLGIAVLSFASAVHAQPSSSPSAAMPSVDPALSDQLISELPLHLRDSCMASTAVSEGAVASAQCLGQEGSLVLYVRFVDAPALQAAYDELAPLTGLEPDTGIGCGDGGFEGEYASPDGTVLGRVVCQADADGPIAIWTDDEALLLGVIHVPGGDFGSLVTAWTSAMVTRPSGPISTGSPAPGAAPSGPPSATAVPGAVATPGASASVSGAPATSAMPGAAIRQWATSASASSEYGTDSWSASQATGQPDTPEYGDYGTAWAPSVADGGAEWLELAYDTAVIPTEVAIWETSGNGFVAGVEAWDEAALAWVTLWEGQDQSPQSVVGFSPDLAPVTFATDRLRISIDTAVPGWNEVDAVMLGGTIPEG